MPEKITPVDRESPFEKVADYVSEAMGRPTNILVWFFLVVAWTIMFATGLVNPAGTFLPNWFTSEGFNFPLNLVTTVAELFIGFLVAAASNRSERNLNKTLAAIRTQEQQIEDVEGKLTEEMVRNTDLTSQVHELAIQLHNMSMLQGSALGGLTHINAELSIIRTAVSPTSPNPSVSIDEQEKK